MISRRGFIAAVGGTCAATLAGGGAVAPRDSPAAWWKLATLPRWGDSDLIYTLTLSDFPAGEAGHRLDALRATCARLRHEWDASPFRVCVNNNAIAWSAGQPYFILIATNADDCWAFSGEVMEPPRGSGRT